MREKARDAADRVDAHLAVLAALVAEGVLDTHLGWGWG